MQIRYLFSTISALLLTAFVVHASEETAASNVRLYDDLGTLEHPVTTDSSDAQAYFNQGLRLSFGFWWDEAARSFKEATRLDPDCAMAYWGVALALGPYVNDAVGSDPEGALAAIQKAQELAGNASESERAYILALSARYADDLNARRADLDMAYANAMRELTKAYPDDLDGATMSAAAIMNTHRWNYWDENGEPSEGTQETVARAIRITRARSTTTSTPSKPRPIPTAPCRSRIDSVHRCPASRTCNICRATSTSRSGNTGRPPTPTSTL